MRVRMGRGVAHPEGRGPVTRILAGVLLALVLDQRPRVCPLPYTEPSAAMARVSLRRAAAATRRARIDCVLYQDAVSFGAQDDMTTTAACSTMLATGETEDDTDPGVELGERREEEYGL